MNTNREENKNVVKAAASVCVNSYKKLAAQFERVKAQLLAELRDTLQVPDRQFNLALNEAEAVAWQTDYPHLFFPVLAAEKVQGIALWKKRQVAVRGFAITP